MFEFAGDLVSGVARVAALDPVQPTELTDDQLLDHVEQWEAVRAWVDSRQLAVMAEFATRRPAKVTPGQRPVPSIRPWLGEFAADEIAAVLTVSRRTAEDRLLLGLDLLERFPATYDALAHGRITLAKARLMSERTVAIDGVDALTVEERTLPKAAEQTPGELRVAIDRAVAALDPTQVAERKAKAIRHRSVEHTPLPDGMAGLWLTGTAEAIAAARTGIEVLARRSRSALGLRPGDPGDPGIDALRSDAAIRLLMAGANAAEPGEPATGPLIQVAVHASTMLGVDDAPAELIGYGPISAQTAREIAHWRGAHWQRILTDPATGLITDIATTTKKWNRQDHAD